MKRAQILGGPRISFVVRFYGISQDRREWRGQVEHVQTGERQLFHGEEQLLGLLERLIAQEQESRNSERMSP